MKKLLAAAALVTLLGPAHAQYTLTDLNPGDGVAPAFTLVDNYGNGNERPVYYGSDLYGFTRFGYTLSLSSITPYTLVTYGLSVGVTSPVGGEYGQGFSSGTDGNGFNWGNGAPGGIFDPGTPVGSHYLSATLGVGQTSASQSAVFSFSTGSGGGWITEEFSSHEYLGSTYPSPVPEPETYAMMLAGLGLLAWQVKRRRVANGATS